MRPSSFGGMDPYQPLVPVEVVLGEAEGQAEVCNMYMEWIQLIQNSRGGTFFGTDPSYGGNPTARNWYAPSYSFYDNARYVTLSRMFGAGFIPIGCH